MYVSIVYSIVLHVIRNCFTDTKIPFKTISKTKTKENLKD